MRSRWTISRSGVEEMIICAVCFLEVRFNLPYNQRFSKTSLLSGGENPLQQMPVRGGPKALRQGLRRRSVAVKISFRLCRKDWTLGDSLGKKQPKQFRSRAQK